MLLSCSSTDVKAACTLPVFEPVRGRNIFQTWASSLLRASAKAGESSSARPSTRAARPVRVRREDAGEMASTPAGEHRCQEQILC